jgi:hypothetical protein
MIIVSEGQISKENYVNWVFQREQYMDEFCRYFPLNPNFNYNTDWKVKPKDARYEQLIKKLNVIAGDQKHINALYPVPPRTKQEIRDNLEHQLNGWCSRLTTKC